jgi:excisionase family DNA binding protein
MPELNAELLTVADAARVACVSEATIRGWARSGRLRAAMRTRSGLRLFHESAVREAVRARDARLEQRAEPDGRSGQQ